MNGPDFLVAMLPEHLLLGGLLLQLSLQAAGRAQRAWLLLSLATVGAAAAAAALLAGRGLVAAPFAGHFSVDAATLAAKAVVLALALPVLAMARADFGGRRPGAEFAGLLLASLYGACLMLSSDSFLTLFLGLELLSLPVYVLVLLAWQRPQAAEAALKYLVLGGTASAMLLMGVSLLYGSRGAMDLAAFAAAASSGGTLGSAAVVLITLALFLKAAVVPFHGWAPDAYEGASIGVTAYMAVIVKAAVLLAAVRVFGTATLAGPLLGLVAVLPLASMVWGNLAAMRQTHFRRLVAYSSIAHAGYLFYALLGAPAGRLQAVTFYLLAYGLTNLLAFAVLPAAGDDLDRDRLAGLQGLYRRAPFAALAMALAMLSLAGVPPFPGFVAKFLVFSNVVAGGHPVWALLGLLGSYLGLYFYLRVIRIMFMDPEPAPAPTERPRATAASLACLIAALALAAFPGWMLARL